MAKVSNFRRGCPRKCFSSGIGGICWRLRGSNKICSEKTQSFPKNLRNLGKTPKKLPYAALGGNLGVIGPFQIFKRRGFG